MSGSVISAPSNAFQLSEILPDKRSIGGILEGLEPVGSGLVRVVVSGMKYLVDDRLLETLQDLVGQRITISHLCGEWRAGALLDAEVGA
jgi:hypothetical protein